MSPRPAARYPNPTPKAPRHQLPNHGITKNDEPFGPKVKGQMEYSKVKSRFTLLGGKKAICRGSGPDWRAGAGARVWSPLPPGLSKESGER